jgi:serine phosphatase RsbU (regulator of sigma subunit)
MIFYNKSILLLFLLLEFIISSNTFSQTRYLDSLYSDFILTKKIDQKFDKGPRLVNLLSKNNNPKKAELVIADLQKIKVKPSEEKFQKGIVLLSWGLLYSAIDDIPKGMSFTKQSMPFLSARKSYLAEAQSLILLNYDSTGQSDSCIIIGNQLLPAIKRSKNINSELEAMMCIAKNYDVIGDKKKAIALSLEAIDIAIKNHKTRRLSELYINLASFYKDENLSIAKRYAILSTRVMKNLTDVDAEQIKASSYLMLGNVYSDFQNPDSAIYFYNLSKVYAQKTNNQRLYLAAIGNIGNIAIEQKEYDKALEYNLLTLIEYKKIAIPTEIAVAYGSLADIYKDLKDYKKAIKYYDSALVITKQIRSADDFIYNYKGLSETYEMMGNSSEALKYYKLYRMWNDSVNNNQNSKKINELELDYKYKAEQREKDLIQKNKDDIIQEKIKQQKYIIWVGILGGLILFVFLGFALKSNINKKQTNKQLQLFNNEITEQKNIIEEKNHEITDSITYASRIQQGVIPDEDELKELLPHHFVFFKPRDIVSGDFYWACKVKSKTDSNLKRSVVAVVDCTGHGVPGAFMSLVGNTLLNQTINRSAISNPAQALDYINQQLPKTIKSKSSTGTIKDGMEIAMCDFNFDTLTMQFAGANSNIYVVRDGEIQIYRGDKQPIGESFSGTIINYTNQLISLQKNDCVYLISDGYADQFGGVKGKKFKYKQLENLFCAIAEKEVNEQQEILAKAFDDWKSNHEQVDDVLIMGIKI